MIRVESHIYKKNTHNYNVFSQMTKDAKLIYNSALYRIRQRFINKHKYINDLDRYFKNAYYTKQSMLYRKLGVKIAQKIYKNIDAEWSSFFAAIKSYKRNPSVFTGRPKMPNYAKTEHKTFSIDNQTFKVNGQLIEFSKPTKRSPYWVHLKPDPIYVHAKFDKIKQLRIMHRGSHIKVEIVYEISDVEMKNDNCRYMSIDPGMNNLLTCVSNVKGFTPIIYNGRPLKSINQYYNKKRAHLMSVAMKSNGLYMTRQIRELTDKRSRKITQYMHEVSKSVIETALSHDITMIVIGKGSTESKSGLSLGKRTNQNFVSIPFSILISQIRYKAEQVGIRVELVEESYTSGTSFLDGEYPSRDKYDKSRRLKRGLFRSNSGKYINADVNGAYQIMKKVTPGAYSEGVEGLVFNPVKKRIRYC